MKRRIEIRPAAQRDLAEIDRHTDQQWGRRQTRTYLVTISGDLDRICDHPEIGSDQSHVAAGLRKFRSGSHNIYYRHDAERIIVIRVLHVRMDVTSADWPAA